MNDGVLQLAFGVFHNPGVYALLLGSGVSRAAEIRTGYEITLDLILKVAAAKSIVIQDDPWQWFVEQYGEEPKYDGLLAKLGRTAMDRSAILRGYFEPADEERERGAKLPTKAHQAIASLIKSGYIRVVLTTNFDRLLEQALHDVNVVPEVIYTDDMAKGARPLEHSPITIVKLNGDYKDERIRNTPEELRRYPRRFNALLRQVFENYGLIICGWSAEWDEALRSAMLRTTNRRFPTFWVDPRDLGEKAQLLAKHRDAHVLKIADADTFFSALFSSIDSLKASKGEKLTSVEMVVERVKRLIPRGDGRIELEDLVSREAEEALDAIGSEQFWSQQMTVLQGNRTPIEAVCKLYYPILERTLHIVTALSWYSGEQHLPHVEKVLSRWTEPPPLEKHFAIFRWIPYVMLLYTLGISAAHSRKWPILAAIIHNPRVRSIYDSRPRQTVSEAAELFFVAYYRKYVPFGALDFTVNECLFDNLRSIFRRYIPSDVQYAEAFDLFETILSLAYLQITKDNPWMPIHLAIANSRSWNFLMDFWRNESESLVTIGVLKEQSESLVSLLRRYQNLVSREYKIRFGSGIPDYSAALLGGTAGR